MRPRTLPPDRKARLVAAAVFVVLAVSLVLAGYGYYRIDNDEILADAQFVSRHLAFDARRPLQIDTVDRRRHRREKLRIRR